MIDSQNVVIQTLIEKIELQQTIIDDLTKRNQQMVDYVRKTKDLQDTIEMLERQDQNLRLQLMSQQKILDMIATIETFVKGGY